MAMRRHLYCNPGVLAIWSRDSAQDPPEATPEELSEAIRSDPLLADPFSYLNRVHYHSAVPYLGVDQINTVTITCPARRRNSGPRYGRAEYPLFAHGLPGVPLAIGNVMLGGVWRGLYSSIIVQERQVELYPPFRENSWRMLTLATDEANVKIIEQWDVEHPQVDLASQDYTIKAGVFNVYAAGGPSEGGA